MVRSGDRQSTVGLSVICRVGVDGLLLRHVGVVSCLLAGGSQLSVLSGGRQLSGWGMASVCQFGK